MDKKTWCPPLPCTWRLMHGDERERERGGGGGEEGGGEKLYS